MTRAQKNLERPVSRELAARKVARIRGLHGREGGWLYTASGHPVAQGYWRYSKRLAEAGVIAQDDNGKWFVNLFVLTQRELAAAETLFGGEAS